MRFDATVPIANGVTDPDPLTTPASVPSARVVAVNSRANPEDRAVTKGLLLALAGTGTETVTLEIYALDEATEDLAVASRTYYLVATGQVVTHGQLLQVTTNVPPGGRFYFRQTAETVAADRELKIAAVDR